MHLIAILITNSITIDRQFPDKVKVLSVAPLIAQAIERIHNHKSVSDLFRQMAH